MKLELKTDNDDHSKSIGHFLSVIIKIALIIIFCDLALKIGIISRQYQIDFNCKLLTVEKSKSNFKKLSSLSKLKSKQQIWEFCREVVN